MHCIEQVLLIQANEFWWIQLNFYYTIQLQTAFNHTMVYSVSDPTKSIGLFPTIPHVSCNFLDICDISSETTFTLQYYPIPMQNSSNSFFFFFAPTCFPYRTNSQAHRKRRFYFLQLRSELVSYRNHFLYSYFLAASTEIVALPDH